MFHRGAGAQVFVLVQRMAARQVAVSPVKAHVGGRKTVDYLGVESIFLMAGMRTA
jgi:hypothetical protein